MNPFSYRKTYRLSPKVEIEFILDSGRISCIWAPDIPRGRYAKKLLPAYRKARDDFYGSLGLNSLIIEI